LNVRETTHAESEGASPDTRKSVIFHRGPFSVSYSAESRSELNCVTQASVGFFTLTTTSGTSAALPSATNVSGSGSPSLTI